jgi:hypothetical protein
MNITPPKSNLIGLHARTIEAYLCTFMGYEPLYSSEDFITSLSDSFLEDVCPEALDLPGALVIWEEEETSLVSIHLRKDIFQTLDESSIDASFLSTQEGLSDFLILTEEISHFQYYTRHAASDTPVSRFEMELQAEIEKLIVGCLLLSQSFGRSHVKQLTQKVFNESAIHGSMTDYRLASKMAENFWKQHLHALGDSIISDSSFRRLLQEISRKTGQEKQRLLKNEILKSAA